MGFLLLPGARHCRTSTPFNAVPSLWSRCPSEKRKTSLCMHALFLSDESKRDPMFPRSPPRYEIDTKRTRSVAAQQNCAALLSLFDRMSTHLWKCRVNSRETHASTEALARVLAAPFSPYEEKIRDLWPRQDQLKEDPARRGHPENSPPATVTPFKVSVFLTVIEALCRQEKTHTERETNREASKGCTAPRMPTNRHRPKSCSTAQQKQELKRRDLPPCLRYRCPRTEARRDSGRHTQLRQAVASRKDSLLCWQTRQAEAYLQWFHHCPHVAKKTEESGDASPERSRETDELRAREPEGWRGEEADFNIPFRTPGNEGNIDSLFFSLPSHTHL
ncbi:hypothetical protein TGRH88_014180 [Toxoplasma gondii]|uniref:Uncharacterized protein n=1 Tax=Toxoplasma gondii TaxID=5811 RepID=A0A7J6KBS6_TOXGO|nr:hypothetical protein TGRH88_014180 [Toxoplasma gondii]